MAQLAWQVTLHCSSRLANWHFLAPPLMPLDSLSEPSWQQVAMAGLDVCMPAMPPLYAVLAHAAG